MVQFVHVEYKSRKVDIPADFLTTTPPDAEPTTVHEIDFSKTKLPEKANRYAVVLDNVISRSECAQLLTLVESSVVDPQSTPGGDGWTPAMVNAGPNIEVLDTSYRNSDRIIWDEEVVMERLLSRCLAAEGMKEKLSTIKKNPHLLGDRAVQRGESWRLTCLNRRMRFLRYGKGQFFRPHCDGSYAEPAPKIERSFYTLHLYLNDSAQTSDTDKSLVGGATSFLSHDEKRRVDVDPKAGRVLIFQHRDLYHCGDDVLKGVKYTMRTDIMYELVE